MFVSFRKSLSIDTPQTSPFTTPERQKFSSETPKLRGILEIWNLGKKQFLHKQSIYLPNGWLRVKFEQKYHRTPRFGQLEVHFVLIQRNIRGVLWKYTYKRWVSHMNQSFKHIINHR